MRAWRSFDRFEGRAVAALVALPDRHQRLPGHAERPQRRARPMDLGPAGTADAAAPATLPEVDLAGADPRRAGAARRRRPGRDVAIARDDPARVRRRAAAPAAAPAGGADPARGAALEGHRGGRTARHQRRVGQQRPAAGAGHARRARAAASDPIAPLDDRAAGAAGPLRGGLRDATTWTRSPRCCTRTRPCRCRRYALWLRGRDDIRRWWLGHGQRLPRLAAGPDEANGMPAFGQYRPSGPDGRHEPWALQVLEISDGRIVGTQRVPGHRRAVPAVRPARSSTRGVSGRASQRPHSATSSSSCGDARRRLMRPPHRPAAS